MKPLIVLFGVLLVLSAAFAISGATVLGSAAQRGRWLGLAGSSVVTEGGNVTNLNITGATLTDRWASFYGNTSGSIVLTDANATNDVYFWTLNTSSSGLVCVSENGTFGWSSSAAATGAQVNSAWSLGTVADNATNTFTNSAACNINMSQAFVSSSARVNHTGLSTYWTCAIGNGINTVKTDFAFCTNITASGTNWNGEATNYEIMVPTTPGIGTLETYYFYAQLS